MNQNKTHINAQQRVKLFCITIDPAERGVIIMTQFNNSLTTNEEQRPKVVEKHWKDYPDGRKITLLLMINNSYDPVLIINKIYLNLLKN